ncbi:hypothetical protein [Ferruginibacter sp. HRS2-29]|uniref:hypothetical protein n=1 Tax=Ferruginibacter sp. HRS2-29 TaxID=2487334 RepID=UPI0020CE380F|nr:hypothetical protein [Ferruginibacter sp. HRS2-29]
MYFNSHCPADSITGIEKKTSRVLQQLSRIFCLFLGLLCFVSCKKDTDDDAEEALPLLGTCTAVSPVAGLTYSNPSGPYTLHTSGGGKVVIDPALNIIISHDAYPGFTLELWGTLTVNGGTKTAGNHENLNGKHIKDRFGNNRTILFPDGAKLTLVTEGPSGKLLSVTLYDGATAHHINTTCNKLEYSAIEGSIARCLDEEQPDGETGGFEISTTGLKFFNIYVEETKGNKVTNRYELGQLIKASPNQVNDFFDDPRLAAT